MFNSLLVLLLSVIAVRILYGILGLKNKVMFYGLCFLAVGITYFYLTKSGMPIIGLRYGVIPTLRSGDVAEAVSLVFIFIGGVITSISLLWPYFAKSSRSDE